MAYPGANAVGAVTSFPQGFASGLAVRNMPLLQMQPGQVFFVNNSPVLNPNQRAGANGNKGTFLDPFATVKYALDNFCVQGRGDIIMVGAGHKETISDASTLALNCAGVAIIGMGAGSARPQFTLDTAATANIPIRSSNMTIQNCQFIANFADIAAVFTGIRGSSATSTIGTINGVPTLTTVGAVTGAFYPGMSVMGTGVKSGTIILRQLTGTTNGIGTYEVNVTQTVTSTTITAGTHNLSIDNCEFNDLTSVLNFLTIVTGNATAGSMNGLSFTNNKIMSLGTTANTTAIILSSATTNLTIANNFGVWAVLNDTACMLAAGANNMLSFLFAYNVLEKPNTSSTGGSFISTSATAWTGHAVGNVMYQLDNTAGIWIATSTGGAFGFSNNYSPITGAVDKSGLINPAAV